MALEDAAPAIVDFVFSMFQLGTFLLIAVVAAIIVLYLRRGGVFTKRDVNVFLFIPRANTHDTHKVKGRFIKHGKFEVYYGVNDSDTIQAPGEEFIYPRNTIYFLRKNRESYFPLLLEINEEKIETEPVLSNAMKVAYANEIKETVERFTKPNALEKYYVPFSIIIGFIIIGIAWYMATGSIADAMNAVANNFGGVANTLKDAQVVIYKNATATTSLPPLPPG